MNTNKKHKILKAPIRISLAVFILGLLFKIMHWPYSWLIITVSCASVMIFYSLRFLNKNTKEILDYTKLILVFSWGLNAVFAINHLPYKIIFNVAFLISFLLWLLLGGYQDYYGKKKSRGSSFFGGAFMSVSMGLVIVGALLKIMHWAGSGMFLIAGLIMAAIWFFLDFFKKGDEDEQQ